LEPADVPALYGSGTVDPASGGFTWVLNSTSNAEARAQVERYRLQGFRASVLTAVVDGRLVHRVAVGQFTDLAYARAARHLLPPDAPADTWILRLDRTP
jgi:cell division septation protein DedD